jgi:proteic killer suppression protein
MQYAALAIPVTLYARRITCGGINAGMIQSFRDRATQRLGMGIFVKRFSGIEQQALRKLDMLHNARGLKDLRVSLPIASKRRQGIAEDSIRFAQDQWRICFTWTAEVPANVEIVDYH